MEARQTTACRASGDDSARFLKELRQLRDGAGLGPAELAARAHYPYDRIRAAEAGPTLPDLPVLSAYVRGCGGTIEEWEERWRSLTSAPTLPLLTARPAGCSTAASAGARIGSISAPVDTPDPSIILAALDRVAEGMAVGKSASLPSRSGLSTIEQRPGVAPGPPGAPGAPGAPKTSARPGAASTGKTASVASAASAASATASKPSVWDTPATRSGWGTKASTAWETDQSTADAESAAAEEKVTEPVVTAAAVTESGVTAPMVTGPATTGPAVTEPAVTEAAVTETAVTETAVTGPAVTEAKVTEWKVTDWAAAKAGAPQAGRTEETPAWLPAVTPTAAAMPSSASANAQPTSADVAATARVSASRVSTAAAATSPVVSGRTRPGLSKTTIVALVVAVICLLVAVLAIVG